MRAFDLIGKMLRIPDWVVTKAIVWWTLQLVVKVKTVLYWGNTHLLKTLVRLLLFSCKAFTSKVLQISSSYIAIDLLIISKILESMLIFVGIDNFNLFKLLLRGHDFICFNRSLLLLFSLFRWRLHLSSAFSELTSKFSATYCWRQQKLLLLLVVNYERILNMVVAAVSSVALRRLF